MKRSLLYIILIVLSTGLTAQGFHGGILAGFTASQVDGDSYSGYNKLGLQGGVYVSYGLLPWLDGKMEIRYASRGARNPASKDNTGSYLLALHYIDVPLMGAIKIKDFGAVELGVIPGYLFSANGEDEFGKLNKESLVDFRKFDLGILIGANINITTKLDVSIRYSYSIFSIRDPESSGSFYYSWFGKIFGNSRGDFNNYWTLGLSYQIM